MTINRNNITFSVFMNKIEHIDVREFLIDKRRAIRFWGEVRQESGKAILICPYHVIK